MNRAISLTIAGILLAGCGGPSGVSGAFGGMWQPRQLMMRNIPAGDDPYSVGWRDGCETMTGILGAGMTRTHAFSYDPEKGVADKAYYRGWRAGKLYCTYYIDFDPL